MDECTTITSTSITSITFFKIFRNNYLLKQIFNQIDQISRTIDKYFEINVKDPKEKIKSYKYKDIPYKEISTLKYGESILLDKLIHDKSFYFKYQAAPEFLRKCTSVLLLKEMYTKYPFIFNQLISNKSEYIYTWVVDNCAESGSLPCLVYVLSLGFVSSVAAMNSAARNGSLAIVRFLNENQSAGCDSLTINCAASCRREDRGGYHVVKYLLENRTEGFDNMALINAGRTKDVELATLLFDNDLKRRDKLFYSTVKVDHAISSGSLEMVKLYHQRLKGGLTLNTLNKAAEEGCLEIVQFIDSLGAKATIDAINFAAANGHYQVVRYLYENRTEKCSSTAIARAAANGHSEIVDYLLVNGCECTSFALQYAAINGHLNIVKSLRNHLVECPQATLVEVVRSNKTNVINMVRYLLRECRVTEEAIKEAVKHGDIELYDLLVDSYLQELTEFQIQTYLDLASHHGHFNLAFHLEKKGGEFGESAFNSACNLNMQEIIETIWLENPGIISTKCLNSLQNAITHNNLAFLQFCTLHFKSGFGDLGLLNRAAEYSRLEMVKDLHFNTQSKCTTGAMDGAAAAGSLDIVKFLHFNRTEGCTKRAVTWAVTYGHYEIAQFLVENRSEISVQSTLDAAAKIGSLQLLEYLWLRHPQAEPSQTAFHNPNRAVYKLLVTRYPNVALQSSIHISRPALELLQSTFKEVYNKDLPVVPKPKITLQSISSHDGVLNENQPLSSSNSSLFDNFKKLFK